MKVILTADLAEAEAIQAAINKAMGYPLRVTHVGEGRHIDTPLECKNYVEILSAEGKEYAIQIADNDVARIEPKLELLAKEEANALTAKIAERVAVNLDTEGYATKQSAAASAEETKTETVIVKGK